VFLDQQNSDQHHGNTAKRAILSNSQRMNTAVLALPISAAQEALSSAARYLAGVPPSERIYALGDAARDLGQSRAAGSIP
jgi:hypothetical protein